VRAISIVLAACVTACESPFVAPPPTTGPPQKGAPATLTLRPDSSQLFVDDTLVLTASVLDSQGQLLVKPISWTVDDSNVVSIQVTGVAIALDSGQTMVHATFANLSDSALIHVAPIAYQSVTAGARHSCAVGNNHRVYCWGSDAVGQLGVVPAVLERPAPTPIAAGALFTEVAAGAGHTCSVGQDFELRCWGANDAGQLGLGGTGGTGLPAVIGSSFDYLSVVAGGSHTCALTQAGGALCWGQNSSGELGRGDTAAGLRPAVAAGGHVFVQLAAGATHTCGLAANGGAVCWGGNAFGQLGDSLRLDQTEPDSVRGPGFAALAAGGSHTCGIAAGTGAAYCWGSNLRGESGSGLPDSGLVIPKPVTGGLTLASLAAGGDFTCGLTTTGAAYCWGANDQGQLGDGTQTDRPAPTPVGGGLTFTALAAGDQHVCGVAADNAIYCWGDGTSGQLGLAVPQPLKTSPTRIPFPN
jgi:hypothetical protein